MSTYLAFIICMQVCHKSCLTHCNVVVHTSKDVYQCLLTIIENTFYIIVTSFWGEMIGQHICLQLHYNVL